MTSSQSDMVLVNSSDDERFFSDSSDNPTWIYPMAKPPPDADYDVSFVHLIQDSMENKHLPSQKSNSDFNTVEHGRNEHHVELKEIPLLLQESYDLPDLHCSESDIQSDDLPPWLCLENNREIDMFKDQFGKVNDNVSQVTVKREPRLFDDVKYASKESESQMSYSMMPHSIKDSHEYMIESPTKDKNSFFDEILMTSTPNLPKRLPKPLQKSSSIKRNNVVEQINVKPIASRNSLTYRATNIPSIAKNKVSETKKTKPPIHRLHMIKSNGACSKIPKALVCQINKSKPISRTPSKLPRSIKHLPQLKKETTDEDIFDLEDEHVQERRAEMFNKNKLPSQKRDTRLVFNLTRK